MISFRWLLKFRSESTLGVVIGLSVCFCLCVNNDNRVLCVVVLLQNVNDCTFKRVFQYMRAAKLVEFCRYPLEDLEPSGGPCLDKKGKVPLRQRFI